MWYLIDVPANHVLATASNKQDLIKIVREWMDGASYDNSNYKPSTDKDVMIFIGTQFWDIVYKPR
jgi:hypothetical protein